MTEREQELAARRVALLARSTALRADIAARSQEMVRALQGADRLVRGVRQLASRPVLVAGAAGLALLFGPRRALRLAGRALVVLGLLKRLLTPRDYAKP